ncbi:tol-pal system YbgF family protein [Planctomycetota bacterium]
MSDERIEKLLQEADRMAGRPARVRVGVSDIRRRANRRRLVNVAGPVAAAAVLMLALGIWSITLRTTQTTPEQDKIALLENQVKQLQARTDAAMSLIQEVLEQERRQQRLDELEAQLASIPDPFEEMQKQVDKSVFMLVFQADRLYRELNQTDSAVEAYNQVIRLFPKNRWAQVARQRLEEIENKKSNKTDSKGDLKWKPQNA